MGNQSWSFIPGDNLGTPGREKIQLRPGSFMRFLPISNTVVSHTGWEWLVGTAGGDQQTRFLDAAPVQVFWSRRRPDVCLRCRRRWRSGCHHQQSRTRLRPGLVRKCEGRRRHHIRRTPHHGQQTGRERIWCRVFPVTRR